MSGSPTPAQTKAKSPSKWRWLRRLIATAFVASVTVACYNSIMTGLARKFDDRQPRDRFNRVLRGAGELNLGPRDAETAVLLVHGFVGASSNFNELPRQLADAHYFVRAVRLPGHGTTPFDLMKTQPSDMLNYIIEQIRDLKTEHKRVFVIGHSMGGSLSVMAATTTDIDGLVLAAPYFRITKRWWYLLSVETWNSLTGWALHWVYKGDAFIQVNRDEAKKQIVSYRYIPSAGSAAIQHFAALARDPDTLEMVRCPVLMLQGKDDLASSPPASEKAFSQLGAKDKKFVTLDHSNHHIFWDYDREQVSSEILDFIRSHAKNEITAAADRAKTAA